MDEDNEQSHDSNVSSEDEEDGDTVLVHAPQAAQQPNGLTTFVLTIYDTFTKLYRKLDFSFGFLLKVDKSDDEEDDDDDDDNNDGAEQSSIASDEGDNV